MDVLHLIPAECCPVWTCEAHQTHKQTRSERHSFTQSTFLLFCSNSKVWMKKRHDALFLKWLIGWSRVWLNTCCVAQWLLNEARTDIPPAGRSGTYSNCEPPTEDEDNRQQWKYLCCNNWQHFQPLPHGPTKRLRLFKMCFWLKLFHFTLPLADLSKIGRCDYLCVRSVCYLLGVRTPPSHLSLSWRDVIRDRGQIA